MISKLYITITILFFNIVLATICFSQYFFNKTIHIYNNTSKHIKDLKIDIKLNLNKVLIEFSPDTNFFYFIKGTKFSFKFNQLESYPLEINYIDFMNFGKTICMIRNYIINIEKINSYNLLNILFYNSIRHELGNMIKNKGYNINLFYLMGLKQENKLKNIFSIKNIKKIGIPEVNITDIQNLLTTDLSQQNLYDNFKEHIKNELSSLKNKRTITNDEKFKSKSNKVIEDKITKSPLINKLFTDIDPLHGTTDDDGDNFETTFSNKKIEEGFFNIMEEVIIENYTLLQDLVSYYILENLDSVIDKIIDTASYEDLTKYFKRTILDDTIIKFVGYIKKILKIELPNLKFIQDMFIRTFDLDTIDLHQELIINPLLSIYERYTSIDKLNDKCLKYNIENQHKLCVKESNNFDIAFNNNYIDCILKNTGVYKLLYVYESKINIATLILYVLFIISFIISTLSIFIYQSKNKKLNIISQILLGLNTLVILLIILIIWYIPSVLAKKYYDYMCTFNYTNIFYILLMVLLKLYLIFLMYFMVYNTFINSSNKNTKKKPIIYYEQSTQSKQSKQYNNNNNTNKTTVTQFNTSKTYNTSKKSNVSNASKPINSKTKTKSKRKSKGKSKTKFNKKTQKIMYNTLII